MVRRPLRNRFERVTDKIPSGPLGKVGQGDIIGTGGFIATESLRPAFQIIPGVKTPGYNIISHNIESASEGKERHELIITAFSEDVAEFVAQYSATPSNINYISDDVELISTDVENERRSYSTYRIVVEAEQEI